MPATTPDQQRMEQLLLAALDAISRNDVGPWAAMFTADGVMEFPYAPPGNPTRVAGQEALQAYLAELPKMIKFEHVHRPVFYHSDHVMVAEFAAEGTAVPTGKAYRQQYVSIIEHRGGQIVRYADYWNPLVAIEALSPTAN